MKPIRTETARPRMALRACVALLSATIGVLVALWLFVPATTAWMLSAVYTHGSPGLRLWSVRRMAGLGEPALEPLMLTLDDPDPETRQAAEDAVFALPPDRIGGQLIGALEREPELHRILLSMMFRRLKDYREPAWRAARSEDVPLRRRAFFLLFLINDMPFLSMGMNEERLTIWIDLAGELHQVSEADIALFRSERFLELYRGGLEDEDPTVRLLSGLILKDIHGELIGAGSPKGYPVDLLFDHPPFADRRRKAARRRALEALSVEALRAAIAEAPKRRGLVLLRLLADPLGSELGDERQRFEKLAPLLPLDQPEVKAELERFLDEFRRRREPAWPWGALLLRPLKLEPEPYLEALVAARGKQPGAEAFAALKASNTETARAALRRWLIADLEGGWSAASMRAVALCAEREIILDGRGLAALLSQADINAEGSWGALMRYARVIAPASSKTARAVLLKLSEVGDSEQSGRALAALNALVKDEPGEDRPGGEGVGPSAGEVAVRTSTCPTRSGGPRSAPLKKSSPRRSSRPPPEDRP